MILECGLQVASLTERLAKTTFELEEVSMALGRTRVQAEEAKQAHTQQLDDLAVELSKMEAKSNELSKMRKLLKRAGNELENAKNEKREALMQVPPHPVLNL